MSEARVMSQRKTSLSFQKSLYHTKRTKTLPHRSPDKRTADAVRQGTVLFESHSVQLEAERSLIVWQEPTPVQLHQDLGTALNKLVSRRQEGIDSAKGWMRLIPFDVDSPCNRSVDGRTMRCRSDAP
jgi:hypothetical protein